MISAPALTPYPLDRTRVKPPVPIITQTPPNYKAVNRGCLGVRKPQK